jgi:hypothetical protein
MIQIALAFQLALAAGLAPAQAAEEQGGGYREEQSGLLFPDRLGPLKRGEVKKYPQPGAGVGIRYSGSELTKADVYVYDNLEKDLGTGVDSDAVKAEFEEVTGVLKIMEQRGYYKGVEKLSEGKKDLDTSSGKLTMLTATFVFEQTEKTKTSYLGKRVSYVLLTTYRGRFLKVRFTCKQEHEEEKEKLLADFLADLGKVLE